MTLTKAMYDQSIDYPRRGRKTKDVTRPITTGNNSQRVQCKFVWWGGEGGLIPDRL